MTTPTNPTGYPAATEIDGNLVVRDPSKTGIYGNITADGNITGKAFIGGNIGMGLQFLTNGGPVPLSAITNAQAAGYQGIFLDPRFVWDMSGLVLNGIKNFIIESRMIGSIGWLGNISYNTGGYIKTDTGAPQDGIQIYASNPSGNPTQGVIFKNCVIVGSNSRAVFHMGGGQRRCGLVDSLVYNTNPAAGAYAVVNGSGLSDNNSEDNIFSFTGGGGLAGAYAYLGIGVADQTQRANDTWYYGLTGSGGQYGIVKNNGGNHTFVEHYDRSNPATATTWNHGTGRMTFIGGEDQNGSGLSHLIDGGGQNILINRAVTQTGTATTTVNVSSGAFVMRGSCAFNGAQTIAVSGGVVDLNDPAINANTATISGSTGGVVLAANYNPGVAPILTTWTGNITYAGGVAAVASARAATQTTVQTLSFTPQPFSTRVRVTLHLRVTVAGTSTVANLTLSQFGGVALNQNLPLMPINGAATAPVLSVIATGVYIFSGVFDTDATGTAVVLTVTPTGSTFTWSAVIERVT